MENLLTPLISLTNSLYSSAAKRVNHFRKCHKRIQDMNSKLEELQRIRDDLKREIERAESGGSERTEQAKGWLKKVEETEVGANQIRAHTLQQGELFTRYKLGKKALKKEQEISQLINTKANLTLLVQGSLHIHPIPCGPTVGLHKALTMALQTIADGDARIIGIYGTGGVGKTTLLKMINNEYLSKTHEFEAVIWVTVSKDINQKRIQRALISRLGLSLDATESQEVLTSRICNFLMRIKFLLLLDDVWRRLDLENIGIPLPDERNKSKVVFTTRSEVVCSHMDANKKLKVDFLNEEDSWRLFSDKLGGMDVSKSDLKPYAEEIVKKCGGLPLALITVGRAMAYRKTEKEWKYAIEVLNNAPSEFQGMEDVFTILKFSYDNLHDNTLKKCFLYCALFPEDYPLEIEQLIDYWIGEGFLDDSNGISLRNKGQTVIGSLKVACLLESGEDDTQIKMHDVVRSFAVWITSKKGKKKERVVVQGCNGLPELPDIKWKKAARISLLGNEIRMLPGQPVCGRLSTLLLSWNRSLSNISSEFFNYMPALKVLDLSVTSISKIPASIGQLVELRYLDLSRTKIISLPEELGCLSKLWYLDLQRTDSLRQIPRDAILRLQSLRVLNLYYSYGKWEMSQTDEVQKQLKFLDLQDMKHLTTLGITITRNSSLMKLSSFHNIVDCIAYLFIKGCEGLIHLMVAYGGGGERLRWLNINDCNTLKAIDLGSTAGKKDWLPSLEVVSLQSLPNLTTIRKSYPSPTSHRSLRFVNIWYCPKLKNVSWILNLSRLEKVYIFYCEEMEEIIGENDAKEEASELHFPSLKTISFRGLPKLRSISEVAISFPKLQTIALIDCPQLKKLPSTGYDSSETPKVYCSKEWWENLEWNDATGSSALHPQFIAI